MGKQIENPSAFPRYTDRDASSVEGMTLRDYFAAHCPITLTEFITGWPKANSASAHDMREAFAKFRFAYADAMLIARCKE